MNTIETLKHYFGYDSLRPGQQELIESILQGRDVLGIMPTGAGKSLCYQVPALMMDGITLVISPLISLMADQVKSLIQAGVRAAYINSSLTENQIQMALSNAIQGTYKIIYVAPERLNTWHFLEFAQNAKISMLTVDEAHCISQWGQDFRPSYKEIASFLNQLPTRPIVSAFTATATQRVKQDIVDSLHLQNPHITVTGFDRPNLFFRVVTQKSKKETDNSIINYVKKHMDESGIIYCSTRKNVDHVYELLNQYDIPAGRYHAGLSLEERKKNQDDFTYDRIQVIVATNAFGMGIDKSNVRYVLHYNMPQSLEYYYQEAGRAGRDGEEAECILFFARRDIMTIKYILQNKVASGQTETDPLVQRNDQQKLNTMIRYCETDECLRQFILSYFGDTTPCTCDKCSNCVVVEDEEEETFVVSEKAKKKSLQLANLTPVGQDLFEQLRQCRTKLAQEKSVPPYVICSDKTLKDMCAKCPTDITAMSAVYGMGAQKTESYGHDFAAIIEDFLKIHKNETTTSEDAAVLTTTIETVSSTRKKKLPFYLAPEKLNAIELTDQCMLTELATKINALCDDPERKKLTASFINRLLIEKGYLEEVESEDGTHKRVTAKGQAAGILEEERLEKKNGRHYYALIHTRDSQEMILRELQEYLSSQNPDEV